MQQKKQLIPLEVTEMGGKLKKQQQKTVELKTSHLYTCIYMYTHTCTNTLYIHTCSIVSFLGKLSFDNQFEYHIK